MRKVRQLVVTDRQTEVGWSGMDMPNVLVDRWQAVYSAYSSADGDQVESARLSADIAGVWREMAAVPGLAWWLVAALRTAAEAFERQARNWSGTIPRGRSSRPTELSTRARHQHEVSAPRERIHSAVPGSVA